MTVSRLPYVLDFPRWCVGVGNVGCVRARGGNSLQEKTDEVNKAVKGLEM